MGIAVYKLKSNYENWNFIINKYGLKYSQWRSWKMI